jgi:hypothetical protein
MARVLGRIAACAIVGGWLGVVGCGGGGPQSPTQPTPSAPASLAGTWTGTATDSTGSGRLTWQLEQNQDLFNGTLTMSDDATGASGTGTVSGATTGSTLTFSMRIPAGALGRPFGTCTTEATGTGQVTPTTITGVYAGSNSCTGSFFGGQLTLRRP